MFGSCRICHARLEFIVTVNCWKGRYGVDSIFEGSKPCSDTKDNRLSNWVFVVFIRVLTNQSPAVRLGDEDEEVAVVDIVWVDREGWFELLFGSRNATIDGYRDLLVCWCDHLWLYIETTHRLNQGDSEEITGKTIIKEGKRSTGKPKLRNRSAAGKVSVTLGKPILWLSGICRVSNRTTWFGSLGFVTKIALVVLLWGIFMSRVVDIVDIIVGTIKDGVVDDAVRELWLFIVIVGEGEVPEDWKLVDGGVLPGTESSFRMSVVMYIEVIPLVEKFLEDGGLWNGDAGVEDHPTESWIKEGLHFLVVLFSVRGVQSPEAVSIPGLKDWEIT